MTEMVSIILVNYNTSDYTNSCIQSVLGADYENIEIHVVDNDSTSAEQAKLQRFPSTDYHFLDSNLGFAKACNYGAKESEGDYVFFLNNDTEIEDGAISRLVEELRDPSVGAVTPQVRFYHDRTTIDRDIGHFDNLAYGWHPRQNRTVDEVEDDDSVIETPWISGCALMTKTEVFESIGGFDTDFFMYCEDLEFSIRLQKHEYELKAVTDSIVYHKYSASAKDDINIDRNAFQIKHQSKNRMKIIFKHYPAALIIRNLHLIIASSLYWCWMLGQKEELIEVTRQLGRISKHSFSGIKQRSASKTDHDFFEKMEVNTFCDYINIAWNQSEAYNQNRF
ncbi:glycosyltransferase family 2 protein [Haloarcula sp. CBA1130]|uniref:glycosyltransferase family 2 protein n=1 Tax=unclassified Haloarcula TaxID=2624677 RepID=UPI001246A9C1|nr:MULTISPECIES: glycosyltransferase family 2 protein [unclassified Haloarcula]KAA9397860.1 glycosyltransferase family 2 protein [Haloarcula sp. CBA1129]KAA9402452.1 glycosyltransferase family 2 protein [Haloarcula sp. CBA1130]